MLLKLAIRNLRGGGLRTWINAFIMSLVFVVIIWFEGMYVGWMDQAEKEMKDWEIGGGYVLTQSYDQYDPFSYDSSYAAPPAELAQMIDNGEAAGFFVSSGIAYPDGRRQNVTLKGVTADQHVLLLPIDSLRTDSDAIPVMLGKRAARRMHVDLGDSFVLKWRTTEGVFDAADVVVAYIMNAPMASIDTGILWLRLSDLQTMKGAAGEITYAVLGKDVAPPETDASWRYEDVEYLLSDLRAIMRTESVGEYVIFALLLFMAMIAIFDTQVLALFRRRREMGTLMALGLTHKQLIGLFTLEGVLYAVLGLLMGAVWGTPLLWWFATHGWKLPEVTDSYGMPGMASAILFEYPLHIVLRAIITVLLLTTIVSWQPTLRISKLKPTDALRGK